MQKTARSRTYRVCLDAMFIAIYACLATMWTVRTPLAEFSWSSLPILLCAFLLSPADAIVVALCGSFMEQLYVGWNAQGVFWMIPVVAQAVVAGFLAFLIRKKPRVAEEIVIIVLAETVLTVANRVMLYVFGYAVLDLDNPVYAVAVAIFTAPQFLIRTALSAVVIPLILNPLRRALGRVIL